MMMTKVQTQDDGTKDFWVVTIKKMPLYRQPYECCTNKISAHIEYGDIREVIELQRKCGNPKIMLYSVWVNEFN